MHELLSRFSPSPTALLDWLRLQIDDSMLVAIAKSDYGVNEKEHFAALCRIYDGQEIPKPLEWIPKEVLELTRWSEPDDPGIDPADSGTEGHLVRAFSCAVLLRAADDIETADSIVSENDTLAQAIASVIYLGRDATEAAARLVSWRILQMQRPDRYCDELPFFLLGLLLLRTTLFEATDSSDLAQLAEAVLRQESEDRARSPESAVSDDWLFGLTFFDQRRAVWVSVGQQVLLDSEKLFPEELAHALSGIAERLTFKGA